MARHSYVVTNPSDAEGFKRQVLTERLKSKTLKITAQPTDEFTLRRGGEAIDPKEFELTLVRINFEPAYVATLHWLEQSQDLSFEEHDGKITFGVWTDE